MALPKNRKAVRDLLAELEPRVLGKTHPGFTCNCGAIHEGPGVVTKIDVPGDKYPGQEVHWYLWSVSVSAHPERHDVVSGFSIGLSAFIPHEEVVQIFARYFGENPDDDSNDDYQLKLSDADRVYAGAPPAVCIADNAEQTRFIFDWGLAQKACVELLEIEQAAKSRRIPLGSADYDKVIDVLTALTPFVYKGGPDPELPFESKWLTDYLGAIALLKTNTYNHVFFQSGGSTSDHRGSVYTNGDVVFMKLAVE